MLREIPAVRQIEGEPRRRWFTSTNLDLIVWVSDAGSPTGFQLCYDKQFREHALTWTEAAGFSHMAVDGGESRPARYKGTPMLVTNGAIDGHRILDEFQREAASLPAEFAQMVEVKVRELEEKG